MKSPPVIAHGLFSYQIGGGERVAADLAIEMKRRGYEVVCFAFYDQHGPVRDELEGRGIRCVNLDYQIEKGLLRRLSYQIKFFGFLRQQHIDSLVVHHATALMLCGPAARLYGVRRVVMIEHAIHQLQERPRYRRAATFYCRFAHIITGVDRRIVDYFREAMYVPASKLRYIANGIRVLSKDARARDEVRAEMGLETADFVFLFAGRLQPVKDVPTLIAATAALRPSVRSKIRVIIAGDGPEKQRLIAQAHDATLSERILFLGIRSDIPRLLAAADAFIMTSITEGQPMALIEAMAAGLPCVATSVGGIPALLADGAGVLVPPSSPSSTAQAMARVVEDAALRERCAQKAKERVAASHSIDPVVDAYLVELGLPPNFP